MAKANMKKVGNVKYLSDMSYSFNKGYILIDDMLFLIGSNKSVEGSWSVDGNTEEQMLISARKEADISLKTRIAIDDAKVYSAGTVLDEDILITAEEAFQRMDPEEQDGYDDLIGNWS